MVRKFKSSKKMKLFSKFSQRQLLTLLVVSIADFCIALTYSIQAPFYPQEAEKKGATASEYGFVFGIHELTVFLTSPFFGKYINKFGLKCLANAGIYTSATSVLLFGLLAFIPGPYPFIGLSFFLRIAEALGNAAFLTTSYTIIAKEFPENFSTTFAFLETFIGLGTIIGPTVGGALYQLGGFMTPFLVLGSVLFLCAVLAWLVLPHIVGYEEETNQRESFIEILKIPGVLMASLTTTIATMSTGFLLATLEPHLRKFHLQPVTLGLMFIINGLMHVLTTPFWGWIVDKKLNPKIATLIGCVLIITGFCFIGPAPFIPLESSLWTVALGLVLQGLGLKACVVSSFTDALRSALAHGLPNNLGTYGMVSGLWTSSFALGCAIGPSISGVLYDLYGFRKASLFIIVTTTIYGLVMLLYILLPRRRHMHEEVAGCYENNPIVSSHGSYSSVFGEKSALITPSMGTSDSNDYRSRRPRGSSLSSASSYSIIGGRYKNFHSDLNF